MKGRTHALTGVLIGSIIARAIEGEFLLKIGVLGAALIGSLLPDIDTVDSLFGRKLKLIGWLSHHRGFFHSLVFLLILLLIGASVCPVIVLVSLTAGFLSHLFLDGVTRKGVTLIPKFVHIKGPLRTGKSIENIIFISEIIVLAYLIVV